MTLLDFQSIDNTKSLISKTGLIAKVVSVDMHEEVSTFDEGEPSILLEFKDGSRAVFIKRWIMRDFSLA